MGTQELILLLVLLCPFFGIGLALIALTSYQAYRRGYNPFVWGVACILALNPIFLLVVLALAPHRSRLRLRAKFASELAAKLSRRVTSEPAIRTTPVDPAGPTATAGKPQIRRPTDLSVTRSMETRSSDPPT